jgi:hypothetical protein
MPNNKGKTKKEARESHEQTQKKIRQKNIIRVIRGQICFLCLIRLHSQLKCKSQHLDRG